MVCRLMGLLESAAGQVFERGGMGVGAPGVFFFGGGVLFRGLDMGLCSREETFVVGLLFSSSFSSSSFFGG